MPTFIVSITYYISYNEWPWLCFTLKPFLPFTNPDCMATFIVPFHILISFPSPIVIVCQPSLYHYTCNFTSLYQSWLYANLHCTHTTFPSLALIVIVLKPLWRCQPSSYHSTYYFPSLLQSWLYVNLHRIITHTTFLSFTKRDCMPILIVHILHFLHWSWF